MPTGGGGQQRTIICDCGWATKDSVRASNMKFKLHQKVCPNGNHEMPPAFNAAMNGYNGIIANRRGNLQHAPLVAQVVENDIIVGVANLIDILNVREEKKD